MKDIKNYEGLYGITSCGKVWSYTTKRFLKPRTDKYGYQIVNLSKDGKKKTYFIHRLVCAAYIPNPENKPQVNHLDEIKEHNYVNNLCWATPSENINHGTHNKRCGEAHSKAVLCVELNKVFKSMKEAAEAIGIDKSAISHCCRGKTKTAGKYHWRKI